MVELQPQPHRTQPNVYAASPSDRIKTLIIQLQPQDADRCRAASACCAGEQAASTCSGAPTSPEAPTIEDMGEHGAVPPAASSQPPATATDPFPRALRDLHLNDADRSILEAELVTDAELLSALSEADLVSIGIPSIEKRKLRQSSTTTSGGGGGNSK